VPLIDDVHGICSRLAALGWRDLLLAVTDQQLDIAAPSPAALAERLVAPLSHIDRQQPGFEDFAGDGRQAITPGSPARSLLYHALASPLVDTDAAGAPLAEFPTHREIDVVENYVFGVQPPSVQELLDHTAATELSVVVFAYEYRPAKDTCAGRHADLAFARTGIARIGTRPMLYRPAWRGFWVEADEDPFGIHVCPAHYAPFLAVRRKGDPAAFLPMRHQQPQPPASPGDAQLDFWVPVHKLYDGTECLRGLDLHVTFEAFHVNEKLRRVHLSLGEANPPSTPPFRFTSDIAELVSQADFAPGLLAPVPHERLVEPAKHDGAFLTFRVPANNSSFFASYEPGVGSDDFGEIRPAPAYVHARTQVNDGTLVDLTNDPARPDVRATVRAGDYDALHYVDFTGEGQVSATCGGLAGEPKIAAATRPAYSLVSAPDPFPACGQRELTDWAASAAVPNALRPHIWAVPPAPLSDVRLPPNLQLPGNQFDATERGVTAVVGLFGEPSAGAGVPGATRDVPRHSSLPDDAAGVFAPGWDVAHDQLNPNQPHLAAYGLGSPFPEDAKLCAALSSFWPAVAPDASRTLEPNPNPNLRATVAPLTDAEIGQTGGLPWDGIAGPQLVTANDQLFAECERFFHADYVETGLENRFTLRLTARVSTDEYERRVLAIALAYRVLGGNRNVWSVLSFLQVLPGDAELQRAQIDASTVLAGAVYRIDVFRIDPQNPSQPSPTSFRRARLPVRDRRFLFVDPDHRLVLVRRSTQTVWTRATVNL
jgi:hypothetical protein